MTVLNAELKSINSIQTYVSFLPRWVTARWTVVMMTLSAEQLGRYANFRGSSEGGSRVWMRLKIQFGC